MALSLPALDRIERDKLVGADGRCFKEFRRSLKPSFVRVWVDIGLGYLMLGALVAGVVRADHWFPRAFLATAVVGGFGLGYVMSYLLNFFHEASHYNIAKTRQWNDFLANAVLGLATGQSIKAYRVVHMDHHRLLGTAADTEHSYFEAPHLRFLVESLTGIRLIRVILARGAHVTQKAPTKADTAAAGRGMLWLGLLCNLAIVGWSAWASCWSLVFAWPFGMLVIVPAVTSMRQLLEHRCYDARSDVDYSKVDHGAMSRMFGVGPIASTMGSAGFNRHLLHHWEPQISYTNLAELEAFLRQTEAAPVLDSVTTTYWRAFLRLVKAP